MGMEPDWTLATIIHAKDESFKAIISGTGDKLQASEEFAARAQEVFAFTSSTDNCDTLCFMSNVKTLREQTAEILEAAGRDNEVRSVIAPLAQELHIRL